MLVILLNINEELHYATYNSDRKLSEIKCCEESKVEKLFKELTDDEKVSVMVIESDEIEELVRQSEDLELVKTYDSRIKVALGNHLNDNTWCVFDSLSEDLVGYTVNGKRERTYFKIQIGRDRFLNRAFDQVPELNQIEETEKEEHYRELINTLRSRTELPMGTSILRESGKESIYLDYPTSINELFGEEFIDNILNDFSELNFYLFGDFLNHSFIKSEIRDKGRMVHLKDEKNSIRFFIEGALKLYKHEVSEEWDAKIENPVGSIDEYEKLYQTHAIRLFYTFDKVKPKLKPERKEEFEAYLKEEIGKKTEIDTGLKDIIFEKAETEYNIIDSTWVSDLYEQIINNNKAGKEKIENKIINDINTKFFDLKLRFFKKNKIRKQIIRHDTKGYSIDVSNLFESHYNSLLSKLKEPSKNLPQGVTEEMIKVYRIKTKRNKKLFILLSIICLVVVIYLILPPPPPPPPPPEEGPYDSLIVAIETDGLDKEEVEKLFDIVIDPSEDDDDVYKLIEGEFQGKNLPDVFYSWKVSSELIYQSGGSVEKFYEIKDFLDLLFAEQYESTVNSIELLDFNKNNKSIELKIDYK